MPGRDYMHVRALFEDGRVADEKNWTILQCPESYLLTIQPDYTMTFEDWPD